MIERYDEGIVITPDSDRWYFDAKKDYKRSVVVQTNGRFKDRASDMNVSFYVQQPEQGCVVLLGIYQYRKLSAAATGIGSLEYAAYIFEDGKWQSLPPKKWIEVHPEVGSGTHPGHATPRLALRIGGLSIELPADIILDFWADWLTVADVMAIHQELVNLPKFECIRQALELTKKLKGALGIQSKVGHEIQILLEDVLLTR